MSKAAIIFLTTCFSILVVLYSATIKATPGNAIVIHYDAPIWIVLQCFLSQWLSLKVYGTLIPSKKEDNISIQFFLAVFVISGFIYLFLAIFLTLSLELFFGIQEIDKRHVSLLALSLIFLHVLNCGTVISFKLIKGVNEQRLDLERVQKLLLEKQLEAMQQKLDPHFLFNNLNVLSALIGSNPEVADEFLDKFTNIYRYVLECQDFKTISLDREITFAMDYMSLVEQRFSHAYKLDVECRRNTLYQHVTLPCSLQLALENVIKHNQGDRENPLWVKVIVTDHWLEVRNKIRPKVTTVPSGKLGLINLRKRSEMILGRSIEVMQKDGEFMLRLPLACN
ncbi:sensor histidine kinase [Microbulbifer sp. SSSA007]|uniref:sensor histidine kinase n=1 Tax=Microbulbifer sp. SSSA007 TaxID=3243379 RepID=UPI0040397C35